MESMQRILHIRSAAFILLMFGVIGTAIILSTRLLTLENPEVVALGIALDLTLTLPVAFYLLIARPKSWRIITVAPVAVVGFLIAHTLLPADQRDALKVIEWILIPVELLLVTIVFLKIRRVLGAARGVAKTDPVQLMQDAAHEVLPSNFAAAALATELAVFHYTFFSWRGGKHIPEHSIPIGIHQRGNHGAILVVLFMVAIAEGLAAHFLLGLWSGVAAWIMTGLGVYGVLWLIADYRATILRPVLIDGQQLRLRAGLRFRGVIEQTQIESHCSQRPETGNSFVSFTLLTEPTHWIKLRKEASFEGPYGIRKKALYVGLTPDEPQLLEDFMERDCTSPH